MDRLEGGESFADFFSSFTTRVETDETVAQLGQVQAGSGVGPVVVYSYNARLRGDSLETVLPCRGSLVSRREVLV